MPSTSILSNSDFSVVRNSLHSETRILVSAEILPPRESLFNSGAPWSAPWLLVHLQALHPTSPSLPPRASEQKRAQWPGLCGKDDPCEARHKYPRFEQSAP